MVAKELNLGSLWRERRFTGKASLVVAALMALYHLLFVSATLARMDIYISLVAHRALSLTFMLVMIFLTTRAKKKSDDLPWYDMVLIVMSLVSAGYIFAFSKLVQDHIQTASPTAVEIGLFFILLIASFEAARRLLGLALPIIALFFLLHALFTSYFPGILHGRSFSIQHLTTVMYMGQEGIFGLAMGVASTIIVVFIIFAELLRATGAAHTFLNLAMVLMGRWRGGPAKISVVGSAMFATISGSPSANVAAIGSITIPLMKASGYQAHFAAAVEAVSGKGGQITPPVMGAVAFIMADVTGLGYLAVCIAAALPALLYFVAVFFQVDFEAGKTGLKGLPPEQLPSLRKVLKKGWHHMVPLLTLVLFMVQLKYNPEMAAVYSMLVIGLVSSFSRETRLGAVRLLTSFESAVKAICLAGITCALAGVILGSLMGTGLGVTLSSQLVYLSGGNLFVLLLLTALSCYILGMGVSSVAIYVILATLVAPALTKMGVTVQAAHLFVIYWGNIAFISPPVATSCFIAGGIAGADPMKVGWQAVRLAIVSFTVPFIFVYDSTLLAIGPPAQIALTTVRSIAAVITLAAGLEGYLLQRTHWIERIVLLVGGLLLLTPLVPAELAGFAMAGLVLLRQMRRFAAERRVAEKAKAAP